MLESVRQLVVVRFVGGGEGGGVGRAARGMLGGTVGVVPLFAVGELGDDRGREAGEGVLDGDAKGEARRGFVASDVVEVPVDVGWDAGEDLVGFGELSPKLTKEAVGELVSTSAEERRQRATNPLSLRNSALPKSSTSRGTLTSSSSLSST